MYIYAKCNNFVTIQYVSEGYLNAKGVKLQRKLTL